MPPLLSGINLGAFRASWLLMACKVQEIGNSQLGQRPHNVRDWVTLELETTDRRLMLHGLRDCITNVGYTSDELSRMFELLDQDGNLDIGI